MPNDYDLARHLLAQCEMVAFHEIQGCEVVEALLDLGAVDRSCRPAHEGLRSSEAIATDSAIAHAELPAPVSHCDECQIDDFQPWHEAPILTSNTALGASTASLYSEDIYRKCAVLVVSRYRGRGGGGQAASGVTGAAAV
jgi:hypothetical protein